MWGSKLYLDAHKDWEILGARVYLNDESGYQYGNFDEIRKNSIVKEFCCIKVLDLNRLSKFYRLKHFLKI